MLVYVHWFLKLQQMTCLYHEQLYDAVSCYIYMYSCQQEQYPWKALCIHWLVYQTAHTSSNEFKEVPENGGCLDPKTSGHRHATQRMKKQSDVSRCIPWYVLQRVWSLADVGIHIFAAVATVSRSLPANETKKILLFLAPQWGRFRPIHPIHPSFPLQGSTFRFCRTSQWCCTTKGRQSRWVDGHCLQRVDTYTSQCERRVTVCSEHHDFWEL